MYDRGVERTHAGSETAFSQACKDAPQGGAQVRFSQGMPHAKSPVVVHVISLRMCTSVWCAHGYECVVLDDDV
jgi:hypothetical protein